MSRDLNEIQAWREGLYLKLETASVSFTWFVVLSFIPGLGDPGLQKRSGEGTIFVQFRQNTPGTLRNLRKVMGVRKTLVFFCL